MFAPNCDTCQHVNDCSLRIELRQLREDIFNINREKSGRMDFIYKGKRVTIPEEEAADV